MKPNGESARVLRHAARYAESFHDRDLPLHPAADAAELRQLFDVGLPQTGRDGNVVIDDLIKAAEPGLVGNTRARFFAWVMGGSHPTGVAADWLTSVWGQNAAIYQTAPAAAIAEEVAAGWLLDLLDLPGEASVGFTTGATMGGFICLAAARGEVLRRAGCDIERDGLQGAPLVRVFISDDAHASNFAVLRYLGLGERNLTRIATDDQGVMDVAALAGAMDGCDGPKIIICQAGHINSGAFDGFDAVADLARDHNAWMHVDGAFGLWARSVPELAGLCAGAQRADSWAVDGHKWLQLPYDSGFAIMRDPDAHRRAMDISASYLNEAAGDGRNPTQFGPELSRRSRGFAVWAMLQALGRDGVADLVSRHHACAIRIARGLADVPGIHLMNEVCLNQLVFCFGGTSGDPGCDRTTERVTEALNRSGRLFFKTAGWKGRKILRISVIANDTCPDVAAEVVAAVRSAWAEVSGG